MAFRTAPLSLGRIVPRGAIARETPFIPRERPNIKHTLLFGATTTYTSACTEAGASLAWLLSGEARVRYWQSAQRKISATHSNSVMLPYHAVQHATGGTYP